MNDTYLRLSKDELRLIAACLGQLTVREAKNLKGLFENRITELENEETQKRWQAYRDAAPSRDGELEVDENALVSEGGDTGAYVMAWIWVPNHDAGICDECGATNADDGEGYDGLCGDCADKKLNEEEEDEK